MGNPHKGEVTFEALGEQWTMRLGMNEAIELQTHFQLAEDAGPEELLKALEAIKTLKKLRDFFKVVLSFAHPEVDEKKAGSIVTDLGLPAAVGLVLECLKWSLPPKEEAKGPGSGKGKGAGSPGPTS